jgi:hypothetical protein
MPKRPNGLMDGNRASPARLLVYARLVAERPARLALPMHREPTAKQGGRSLPSGMRRTFSTTETDP